jgi:hypothetical protein
MFFDRMNPPSLRYGVASRMDGMGKAEGSYFAEAM